MAPREQASGPPVAPIHGGGPDRRPGTADRPPGRRWRARPGSYSGKGGHSTVLCTSGSAVPAGTDGRTESPDGSGRLGCATSSVDVCGGVRTRTVFVLCGPRPSH